MTSQPSRRVLFILADGARPDDFDDRLSKGSMPNLERILGRRGPVPRSVTTMPSATGPAYLPFLTGRLAGRLNVPGIRWFDRDAFTARRRFHAKRSYVGLGNRYLDADLAPDVRTIFHHEPDHANVFNPVRRGVRGDRDWLKNSRAWLSPLAKYAGGWRRLDSAVLRCTLAALESPARLVVTTFMGIDENAHEHGLTHDTTRQAYEYFDEALGVILARLERRGELDRTRIVVTSDHGLSDTHTHLGLAEFVQGHGYRPLYYPRIWRRDADAAVMVSGNSLAHVYVRHGEEWATRAPRLSPRHAGLVEALARHRSVAFVAHRHDGVIRVVGRDGAHAIADDSGGWSVVTEGRGPLGLASTGAMEDRGWLRATWDEAYPDAVPQLAQLFESPRCGDLVVVSRPGHDLRGKYEIPEHKASHGSLHRDHMMVPLVVNDAGLDTGPCRTVDVFPYLLEQLGRPVPAGLDGRPLARRVGVEGV